MTVLLILAVIYLAVGSLIAGASLGVDGFKGVSWLRLPFVLICWPFVVLLAIGAVIGESLK